MRDFLYPVLFGLLLVVVGVLADVGLQRARKWLDGACDGQSPGRPVVRQA